MQELIWMVEGLVDAELRRANSIHEPKFNSYHEAYAVILEEHEETKEDLESMKYFIHEIWFHIRCDRPQEEIDELLSDMEKKAIHLAAEAIQVAAMAKKARK